jgi:hypothetical protein
MGTFLYEKNDFEEIGFNERFGECLFCLLKRPFNIESHVYKVTNQRD